MIVYAIVFDDKIVEVIPSKKTLEFAKLRPGGRVVDITAAQWLKVGDYWGPDSTKWVATPTPSPEATSG